MESIFIMEVNKDMKAVEVTREGASSTFLLDISIRQEINVCMVPFFPIGWRNLLMCNFVQDWRMKRFVVALEVYIYIRIGQKCTPSNLYICFFITKVILMNQETDDRWHLSREGRYTLFRWIFGHMDWIKSTTRHKRWKLISPHAHLRPPTLITPAKKIETVRGFVGLTSLASISDVIWLSLSNSYHTKP